MRPEQLRATLVGVAQVAALLIEDAAARSARAHADADTLAAALASAAAHGIRGDLIAILESLRASTMSLAAAADAVQAVEADWAAATRKAIEMADQHVQLQAAGAAGAFYQGAAPAPAATGPAPAGGVIGDPLKLGGRFVLDLGETFIGSASTKDSNGTLMAAAAVDTPDGRMIHVVVPLDSDDRKRWKGANAAASDMVNDDGDEVDDDGEEDGYEVDTYADSTVVLDAATAAALPRQIDELVAAAQAADKEYRELIRRLNKAYSVQRDLESRRFASSTDAAEWMHLSDRESHHEQFQRRRREQAHAAAEHLDPRARPRYDDLQERLDAAGADCFEAGQEEAAAAICDLTPAEYQELLDLEKIDFRQRTTAQQNRYDELQPDRHCRPELLAEQTGVVLGLTVDEVRELENLSELNPHVPGFQPEWKRRRQRTAEQQARYDALWTAPGGATGPTAKKTLQLRRGHWTMAAVHFEDRIEWAAQRQRQAELAAKAAPLSDADAARLAAVQQEYAAVAAQAEPRGGYPSATVVAMGVDGDALVIEAVQEEEEGGVDYRMDYRPADADADWSSGSNTDPYRTNAGGLRKAVGTLARLATGTPKDH